MQQGDAANSYYQFYQSHFQNPNPNPNDPQISGYSQWPTTFASAPPVSTTSYPSSDYPTYSPAYPHYSQNPDHVANLAPTAPSYTANNSNLHYATPSQHSYDQNQPPYYSYDHNQNYAPPNPNANPVPNSSYSGAPYSASYDNAYEVGRQQVDHWGGFSGENAVRFKESTVYGSRYDYEEFPDNGVYRYDGGKVEPYGARGTSGSSSSSQVMFDDYGRPINLSNKEQAKPVGTAKVVKAIPNSETEEDVKCGVQKFRIKLLSEGAGQSDMDVLCQIGLDGIRMLDPATSRTLRIYPLETVTRWEVLDSYIFAFWAKTSVDIEPKRIRLKSSSYTTNTILDIVTAASVQLKEIGDRKDSNSLKATEQPAERKKGFDWMNLIKPPNEEKDHWVPDEAVSKCTSCAINFGPFVRKHHCRNCGDIFCDKCTQGRTPLTTDEQAQPVRVCDRCMAEATQRLTNTREAASTVGGLHSHEDLAKKLKEEMDKKLKASSGSRSEGSQTRMQEVACPTCTVHLQVEVPTSGSETIECSVCQHRFIVSAH
ncbi:hypothetical protein Ancab_026622 [Ancistrocladus abbreviatus]